MTQPESQLPPTGTFRATRAHLGKAMVVGSTFSSNWNVVDSAGNTALAFEYHMHLTSQEWRVTDGAGREIATMTRPAGHIHWTYEIRLASGAQMTFRKGSFAVVHESWRLEGTPQGDIDLEGDLTSHHFDYVDGQKNVVARASRPYVTVHDVFDIEVMGLDPVAAVCAAVALDAMEHTAR